MKPSWLERFPGLFRVGRHPTACRWCGSLFNVLVVFDWVDATGHHKMAIYSCGFCDSPGGNAVDGGPIE